MDWDQPKKFFLERLHGIIGWIWLALFVLALLLFALEHSIGWALYADSAHWGLLTLGVPLLPLGLLTALYGLAMALFRKQHDVMPYWAWRDMGITLGAFLLLFLYFDWGVSMSGGYPAFLESLRLGLTRLAARLVE